MIRIDKLSYSVGTFSLQEISLEVERGAYFVLLGPSGSGKTLFLECLCGLNQIDTGQISINSQEVTDREPRYRRVGYVPQDYALFPHLSVRENVAFGLKFGDQIDKEKKQTVDDLLGRFGIEKLADRLPLRLSGGEKQRTALARAIACRPDVLLLDEPVSALDEMTRNALCRDLKRFQSETGVTTIHVCHNFAEMLTVADRVGVIESGRLWQVAEPEELLRRPKNVRVAQFVQAGNLLPVSVIPRGDRVALRGAGGIDSEIVRPDWVQGEADAVLMIRPESICVGDVFAEQGSEETLSLDGTVADLIDMGAVVYLTVELADRVVLSVSLGKQAFLKAKPVSGDLLKLSVNKADLHLLPQEN